MATDRPRRAPFFPWPYPPFLGFAPLDVWFRLLFRPRAVVLSPRTSSRERSRRREDHADEAAPRHSDGAEREDEHQ